MPGGSGSSSNLSEVQQHLNSSDDRGFAECLDRRCRAYDGLGLSKPDKVALTDVAPFKPGDNLNKWMEAIWTTVLLHQGSAALQHWVHEINYLDNSLQPLPSVLHTAVH